ncbi:MAG: hypothetical protein Q7J34_09585 [Bacteroidales bacterium]|jgi:hypothetical protein|nr:hypothetical protein [Bacteroidales bacterium]
MKYFGLLILIIGMIFSSCNQKNKTTNTTENKLENSETSDKSKDKQEFQNFIRKVLIWSDSKSRIDLLPVISDSKDSIYKGFDLAKHKQNLEKLKSTGFFATEFVDNYNQIILTLDKGLRNGEYEKWLVGDLPTFIFANDVNPWCLCQDNMDWNTVEVKIISLDNVKGELEWYWGNLSSDTDPSWKEFKYKFRITKEENHWKIAYLEGFDFKESTRKDGQF